MRWGGNENLGIRWCGLFDSDTIVELKFLVIEFNGLGSSASSLGHNSLEGIYSTS